jgi:hypothetical protein
MGSLSIVEARRTRPAASQRPITCDQAIYTSTRVGTRSGYHIVAASPGLTPEERAEITAQCPTHSGVCEPGPQTRAVAFYPLGSNRRCLAHSVDAGAEHTGRGTRCIYTHVTVMNPEDLWPFHWNPFAILAAVEDSGANRPQAEPPSQLPPLELSPVEYGCHRGLEAAVSMMGVPWMSYIVSRALQGMPMVVGGAFDELAVVEAILLSVPAPMRLELSFSAGLRFSVTRKYAVNAVSGDMNQTRRLIPGQGLDLFEPTRGRRPPAFDATGWTRMVERCLTHRDFDALCEATSQPIPDCTPAALDRIGTLYDDLAGVPQADIDNLLAVADAIPAGPDANEFEAHLRLRLMLAVQSQLCRKLRTDPGAVRYWSDLLDRVRQSPAAADFYLPAVTTLLERGMSDQPIQAAEHAIEAAQATGRVGLPEPLRPAAKSILDHLAAGLAHASIEQLRQGRRVLRRWSARFGDLDRVHEVLHQIERQIVEAQDAPNSGSA